MKIYSREEVEKETLKYFNNDDLATSVWISKYALKNEKGEFLELTPDDMHHRLASEFSRIEKKYPNPMSEDEIYGLLKGFKYVCVTKDTWILTSVGARQVKDLINNPFISVVDNKLYRSSLNGFFSTGIKKIYKIVTKQGHELKATKEHPILVHESVDYWRKTRKAKWITVENLKIKDKIVLHNHRGNFWPGRGTFNEGWIVGNLIGDGSFCNENSAYLSFQGEEFENQGQKAEKIINETLLSKKRYISGYKTDDKKIFVSKYIAELAKEYGAIYGNKIVTEEIEKTSSDFIRGFISGYFDADGSVSNKGKSYDIRLNSSNLDNLKSIQRMLLRIGISSRIYKNRKKEGLKIFPNRKTPSKCKANHDLVISRDNVLLFSEIVGFTVCEYKQRKVLNIIKSNHKFNKEKWFAEVEEIIELEEEEVFDCTIPEIGAFDANGFYVHNCPQGSPMFGIGNNYTIQSLSNCFTLSPVVDSYGGILKTDQELVQIAKRRGGIGFDISNLRPVGMATKNAAITSSGIGPFMERFSNSCREVAQSGRRGALLLSISIHHPEIRTFIKIKRDLKKVTGANISIRLTDEFMNAVKNKGNVQLRFPVEEKKIPKISEYVDANELWNEIIESAWGFAEPGLLMWDTVLRETPSDAYHEKSFRSQGVNPCSELILASEDACRLLLINLQSFVQNSFKFDAKIDYDLLYEYSKKAQRLMDDIIDLELECIDKIINKIISDPEDEELKTIELNLWKKIKEKTEVGRRTGTGVTALGDTLASIRLKYGSQKSIEEVEKIYKTVTTACYHSSIEMAQERGHFPIWEYNLEKNHSFISKIIKELPKDCQQKYQQYGRRNIALTTTAPAGSVSCLTQTTSGIEPVFLLEYTRRKKINPNDKNARIDFVDDVGDSWQEYKVYHHQYKKWMEITGKTNIEESPYWGATSNDVDWKASIDLQAAAQRWVCHSISKTCNVPKDTSKELISEIYMKAWESNCKGFTVYRDGCRTGVLISNNDKEKKNELFPETNAPKRPEILECDLHHIKIDENQWLILVGLLENKPYEILGGQSEYIEIPKSYKRAQLRKNSFKTKNNTYDLIIGTNGERFIIKNVVKLFNNPDYATHTRSISMILRHGAPIRCLVEQLLKDKDADLFSFNKSISRVLKTYIKDGEQVGGNDKICPECKLEGLIYKEGCVSCPQCGYSKCS